MERFILPRRAWRFLTAPVSATGAQSIKSSWQEGQTSGNAAPGYGTQITGGTQENGFDQNPVHSASLKTYSTLTNSWIGVSSTNNPVTDSKGYMLFVRGDRSVNLSQGIYAAATTATLRTTGRLNTGDQNYSIPKAGFTVLGNPFASVIDFHSVTKTNVQDNFYLWDSKITGSNGVGGFVNISWNGSSYDITPAASEVTQYIQSGSAFLVRSMDGESAGSMVIKETDKSSTANINANRSALSSTPSISTNLYSFNADGTTSISDGILNTFAAMYSNSIDKYDAVKLNNFSESLAGWREGTLLTTERRQPINSADTIFLNMLQMKVKSYQFVFKAKNFANTALSGYLEDSYLNNRTAINISGITTFNFDVVNVPGSWNPNRFRLVLNRLVPLPVMFSGIKAVLLDKNIIVQWKVENEFNIKHYDIEKSANGQEFVKVNTVNVGEDNKRPDYEWLDESALKGLNYYRVKSLDMIGEIHYSAVVKVNMSIAGKDQIVIYPNRVINGLINMQFNNQPAGVYRVNLFNIAGQLLCAKKIKHMPGIATEAISISKHFSKGIYKLQIIKPDKSSVINRLLL